VEDREKLKRCRRSARLRRNDSTRRRRSHRARSSPRTNTWGRRLYAIAFLSSGSPQTPLVEFLETDNYEKTKALVAVIRRSDGGKKMYGPGDPLPQVYADNFTTVLFRDHVDAPRAWSKMAVLVHEDDTDAMLNHALLQAKRRGDL
jgi:hypothetical protein